MRRYLNFRTPWAPLWIVATALGGAAVGQAADAGNAAGPASYTWSAELVGLDEAAHTVTVRARIEHHAEIADLAAFDDGDHVTLTWTGQSWGAGIRDIDKGMAAQPDRLTLQATFVRAEREGQYLVFRVAVPAAAMKAIDDLEPGRWITATSPRHPTHDTEAVSAVRPYSNAS